MGFGLFGGVVAHGVEPVFEGPGGEVDARDGLRDYLGAASFRLCTHLVLEGRGISKTAFISCTRQGTYHELATLDVHETRVISHIVRCGQLSACCDPEGQEPFVQDGFEVCSCGIDGGRVCCGTGADDCELGVHASGGSGYGGGGCGGLSLEEQGCAGEW